MEKGVKLVVTGKNATGLPGGSQVREFPKSPDKGYLEGLEKNFTEGSSRVPSALMDALDAKADVRIAASPEVATNIAAVDGKTTIYFANFGGLVPNKVAVQEPARGIVVKMPKQWEILNILYPFLGETQVVKGEQKGGQVEFALPPVSVARWSGPRKTERNGFANSFGF